MSLNRRKFLREFGSAGVGALLVKGFAPAQEVGAARRKILIIGAGLSGLAAAYELEKLGHDVSVFEAQRRIGGRILTVREFDENLYSEAGAARIHRTHDLTHKYIGEFGLPLTGFYPSEGKFSVLENGKAKTVDWNDFAEATEAVASLESPDRWQKIAGGNDLLPRAFEQRLKGKIRYDAPVVKIAHGAQGVTITYLQKGKPETARGNRLISTIPFTMLRKIETEPPFADAKTAIIQNLKYDPATRVSLQTKRRFWADRRLSGFGFGTNFAEIWHATFGEKGTRGILQNYLRGDYALDLTRRTEKERLEITLQSMGKLFPAIRTHFEKSSTKCWSEDPWTLGAWASAGKEVELVKRAEGRVHFAGEHASGMPSWMQGALESARRVTEEVKKASF